MIVSQTAPTYFHAGDKTDFYEVEALNDGGAPTAGKVTIDDSLPAGLVETSAEASSGVEGLGYGEATEMPCTVTGVAVQKVECTTESPVPVGERVIAKIDVEVPGGASGALAEHGRDRRRWRRRSINERRHAPWSTRRMRCRTV